MSDMQREDAAVAAVDLETTAPLTTDGQSEGEGWTFAPAPISDGSQVLAHDGYDVDVFTNACREFPKLQQAVAEWATRVYTAPGLIRDLFWSFYKRVPRIDPVVPLTPAYNYNRMIVEQVLTTSDYHSLYAAGTADDPLTSAMATLGVVKGALGALDAATIDAMNRLAEHESGANQLFDEAAALESLAEQYVGDQGAALLQQARELRADAEAQQAEAERAAAELAAQDQEAFEDAVRQASREAMRQAEGMIDATNDSVRAFTGGYDRQESMHSSGQGLTTKEKMQLARQVQKSRRLRELAAMAGRFTRIALKVQETRTNQPPTEVTNIVRGDDLRRMLPVEYLNMVDPDMADYWAMRYMASNLAQYELKGREKQGQGPIILAIDSSGSMAGDNELWSKAVFLGLLSIARLQKRDMACIHFSDYLKMWHFAKGQAAYPDVIASCEYFVGGGTPFEPWMRKALELVDESRYQQADVICVSDGLSSISREMQTEWNERRTRRGMRSYAVLIGTRMGAEVLGLIADALMLIDNLDVDQAVLETIFAV